MSSGKRLAKRSILGTRVSVQNPDGFFYSGIIQATKTKAYGQEYYSVRLDNNKHVVEVCDQDIIGPGFRSTSSFHFPKGQPVFITLSGREVSGTVLRHDHGDEVIVRTHVCSDFAPQTVSRRKQEVRLLESRKSARLLDNDMDYSRMADPVLAEKRRIISNSIDVPPTSNPR